MRSLFLSIISFLMILLFTGSNCNKGEFKEEELRIAVSALDYNQTLSSNFGFDVTVLSVMPEAGVTIVAVVQGENDGFNYPQAPMIETANATTRVNLINLPSQKVCVCTVTVRSKNTPPNLKTATFRIVAK